jgi:hypothetical protein
MDQDDEFRRQAAEAQQWADRTVSENDRAAWLRIAQSWLGLVKKPLRTKPEAFNDRVEADGTKQEKSTKAH